MVGLNGVVSSDRGSEPRSDRRRGGDKNKKSSFARKLRVSALAATLAVAIVVVFDSNTRLFADYADGYRTEQGLTLPDAVKVWRQDAWRQDDFLAQVRLGDLYSMNQSLAPGESKNASFLDPVEAYVWYYMALRPGHDYRADDSQSSSDALYNIRSNALNNAQELYYSLTFEQRLDARARILYMLSSRGAEGFLTLGRIHSSGMYINNGPSNKPLVLQCMNSSWNRWYSSWLWWLWSSLTGKPYPHMPVLKWVPNTKDYWDLRLDDYQCQGAEPPPEPADNFALPSSGSSSMSGAMALNSGGSSSLPMTSPNTSIGPSQQSTMSGGGGSDAVATVSPGGSSFGSSSSFSSSYSNGPSGSWGGSSSGYGYGSSFSSPVPSVFVSSDSEALTYFVIAARMGHPLGNAYANMERSAIKYYNPDASRIIADAEKRARFWSPPFEYYPGSTAGGMPHTDESQPSLEQRIALARIGELPPVAIGEALDFRGYLKRRGCGAPPPVCFRRAVTQFQTALGLEPTGFLTPPQIVRLVQMAAVDGDAIAQDRLGIMYAKGIGVPQNFVRAEKWFTRSANQRFPDALYNLYVLYKVGPNGIEPDEHRAVSYSAQAIAAGYNPTISELRELLNQAGDAGRDHPVGARR